MQALQAITRWRSRLKPQFGLRTLLLATLMIALGMGWWCRPFEVEEKFEPARLYPCDPPGTGFVTYVYPCGISSGMEELRLEREGIGRIVRVMRRRFWKSPVQHGRTSYYYRRDDRLAAEETWRHGVRHGPERRFYPDGSNRYSCNWDAGVLHGVEVEWDEDGGVRFHRDREHGVPIGVWVANFFRGKEETEYRNGQIVRHADYLAYEVRETLHLDDGRTKEAIWTPDRQRLLEFTSRGEHGFEGPAFAWNPNGSPLYEGWWRAGKRDGRWTFWGGDGSVLWSVDYDHGECLAINGLPQLGLPPYAPEPTRFDFALHQIMNDLHFDELPLEEIAQYVAERNRVPVNVDNRLQRVHGWKGATNSPFVGMKVPFIGVKAPTHVLLSEAFRPLGLTWQVRFDQLWIVRQVDGESWRDRTGVYALPNEADLSITNVLDEQTECEFLDLPLSELLEYIEQRHRTPVWFCTDESDPPDFAYRKLITIDTSGLSLRATLGTLCDQYGLRCEWDHGALVLHRLPEEEAATLESAAR